MRCVIDCEAIQKEDAETNKSKRADIIIRFYKSFRPKSAIIVEAKGWDKKAAEEQVGHQVINYCEKFKILKEFEGKITAVTLTANRILEKVKEVINITWIDLVSKLIEGNNASNIFEKELIEDYCNYLLRIGGNMKYYETEVLSIPAGDTKELIENPEIGIYECPNSQEDPNKKRDGYPSQKKRALYLSFRGEGGISKRLYKVSDIVVMRFEEKDFEALANINQNYAKRARKYKDNNKSLNTKEKRVFFLDTKNSIELPHPTKPKNSNTYTKGFSLHQYFGATTQEADGQEYVILE